MEPANDVTGAVYAEQVGAVFRQLPIAVAVNFVNASLTAAVLAPMAARPFLLPWLLAVLLVTAGRLVLWLRYRRAAFRPENIHRWSRLPSDPQGSLGGRKGFFCCSGSPSSARASSLWWSGAAVLS